MPYEMKQHRVLKMSCCVLPRRITMVVTMVVTPKRITMVVTMVVHGVGYNGCYRACSRVVMGLSCYYNGCNKGCSSHYKACSSHPL